jgi:L-lactate dehydrogenase complex protein LldE
MRVLFFPTCLGDRIFVDAALDAVRLLRAHGAEVRVPRGALCCGQPAFNAGHHGPAADVAAHTVDALRGDDPIVVPSGSCAAMLRRRLVGLLGTDEAASVAARTRELAEFLVEVFPAARPRSTGPGPRVAYHHGCHVLRELGVRDAPLTLLRGIGADVVPWPGDDECCGFGGLFSAKHPPVSAGMADRKLESLPEVDVLTSADGGCLMQLEGRIRRRGLGIPVRHLASVLWQAWDAGDGPAPPALTGTGGSRDDPAGEGRRGRP